ncbi:MAG TPA: acyl-CoA dehydrogenase family protein [Noviherbaspirillum sp.]|uniref:acyl-CoA dehydrogenase family protein n=1 Tax=Noviherbaspirillum sp. TaxID=1926288 RepID=UPI002B48DF41|nr:acyl-CoA dehydrogenase family protein [Noviherbaspirillum sp.]HJV86975.1 acyl-CoA dehydrogenase family protein [Noviherbaspirillum sp.]
MNNDLPLQSMRNPNYYTAEHEQFRDMVRNFVAKEVIPFVNEWDEAGEFPREMYGKAAEIGLLGIGYPEQYGGTPADVFYHVIASEEFARAGCGGFSASIFSHTIGTPPILNAGSEALKARVLPEVLSGRKISALAITEPSGGSDVASLRTTAVRDGDHYIVNGEKTFITSGMRADYYTVAVRTNPEVKGAGGVSLLLIERDTPGFTRTPLKKMGWWCSDTAQLHFDNCRVPVSNLIGVENEGFRIIMRNFNSERLFMAAGAYGFSQVCLADALAWARERKTFGLPIVERQVIRHKLVDMSMKIEATRALLEDLTWRVQNKFGDPAMLVAQTSMLKNFAMQTMQFCADEAVQILGGMGYMRGTRVERIYREVKVNMIGGGAVEIMKDLAAKQLQF